MTENHLDSSYNRRPMAAENVWKWAASLAVVLALNPPASAGSDAVPMAAVSPATVPVFGPRDYVREAGSPRWQVDRFPRPQEDGLTYVLRIENRGSERQYRRTRRAFVKLNGRRVLTPSDFLDGGRVIERPVTLRSRNKISVRVLGRLDSGFTLTVIGLPDVTVPDVTVPDVVGLTEAEATAALAAVGLGVGHLVQSLSLVAPAGSVLAQNPRAGAPVIAGSGALVTPGSSVDLELAATPAGAEPIPDSWAGLWQFDISFTHLDSGELLAEETSEVALCSQDAVGLVVIDQAAGKTGSPLSEDSFCSVRVSDVELDVYCHAEIVFDAHCSVDAIVSLQGTVEGDSLTASGDWSTAALGACTDLPPTSGEAIAVTGIRLDPDPGACLPPRPSFTQQLLRHPNLMLLGLGEESRR